ncbi:PucR family transcriptional regulator [Saccharothrix violaceirubra]|uniref:Purine catabolism regulator n=1 Tax=Saccharothrix violaceirubra TaxID=413306 RepID=A0A7W7T1W1_9PSEU|nr:PucR family transcriptional regulator [Saccharothrix violaceirubra]MBB4964736.1 purine catabolism regulator [Saccharothrix violaceirubra]
MPLTLATLVRETGLTIRVAFGLDRVVSWVHSTELADPTPFLEGGELLLTTGLAAGPYDAYVRRLVDADAVGLGFGTGLSHDRVPDGLVRAAAEIGFPLLEVPRAVPFIAITKAVSAAVAADEYAAVERISVARHRLTRAAVGPRGAVAVVRRLAALLDAGVALLDEAGHALHVVGHVPPVDAEVRRISGGRASAVWQADGTDVALQVLGRGGFLAVATGRPLDLADRDIVDTAASLLTLALVRTDEVDAVRAELRTARFRLLLAGIAVDGVPEPPFRVFVLRHDVADPPGFWARIDGRTVVVAKDCALPAAASSECDDVARGYREASRAWQEGVDRFEDVAGSGLLAPDADAFAEALLAPLDAVLRDSLRVWLGCHGQWDPAAARLGVHRHTMRNRMRRVEELLGRSLDSAGLRAELWLALHAGR